MNDANTKMLLTTAEAVQLVKRSERTGAKFALHVRADAPIIDKPDFVVEDGCWGCLNLSRADAAALVSTMLLPITEERGGRIPITEYRYTRYDGKVMTTYWIG